MRNLKRALSLALAAIMVLGLMVVSAGAASTYDNFADKDEIVNTEAVNTMVSLGVLAGKDDGSYFDPTGIVTRGEMAKIIAVCLNGGKDPVLGDSTNIPKFSDVPSTHWAYNYIAYCVQQNIIAGRGDGTFAPDTAVTGSEAAKMFLCALGYRADLEGLIGNEWELNTNVLANQEADLYEGLETINASAGLSRDNTAQMAYNAVQAQEVSYNNLFGDYTGVLQTEKGNTMLYNRFNVAKITGILEANDKLSVATQGVVVDANGNRTNVGHAAGAVALEGKSLLNVTSVVGGADVNYTSLMGDQSFTVETSDEMVGQEIVIYVKFLNALAPNAAGSTVVGEPILTTNNTVVETSARLKDTAAVRSALREGGMSNVGTPVEVLYTENDVVIGGNTLGVTDTISKALRPDVAVASYNERSAGIFQRFIDNDGNGTPDYIVQIVPVLTSVNSISTDGEDYTFTGINGTISAADIVTDETLARNDVVLINKYADDCYYVSYPDTVEGTVTAFNTNNNTVSVDGTSYGNSGGKMLGVSGVDQFLTEEETIDNTFIFYLDPAGNVLGYKETNSVIGNYAIVRGWNRTGNERMGYSATVKLLMQDGTTATYTLNLAASAVNLGLANASATTTTKENAITVDSYVGDSNNTAHGTNLVDHLFSYTLDGSTVTLGRPYHVNDNYRSNKVQNNVLQTSSNLNVTEISKNTAEYATVNDGKIVANDQTVFFVKDRANTANPNYYVVTGLSKLPAEKLTITSGESVSYVAPGTSTQIAKAIFVTTNNEYKAARDYVFVTDKYVRTNTSGTPVYSFTVVYPDGTTGTMETKSNVNTIKNRVCEYDYDGNYVNFYSDATEVTSLYNQYYVKSVANNTVTLGNIDTGATEDSLRIASGVAIWDVQDEPVADSLAENDVVSLITDTEGAVKAAFIYDVMNGKFVDNPLDPNSSASITVNTTKLTAEGQHVSTSTLNKDEKITVSVTVPTSMNAPVLTINDTTSVTMTRPSAAALVAATTTTYTYEYVYTVTAEDAARGYITFSVKLSQSGLDPLTLTWSVGTKAPDGGTVTPPAETDQAIASVAVTMPTLTVGQALPTATTSTTNVTVSTKWDATGNVEAGKTYTATVTLTAADGYKFTKDTAVTAGTNGTVTAPTADTKTITVTYKIEVKDDGSTTPEYTGEYAPGTYAVDTTGTTPVVTIYQHADKVYTEAELIAYVKQAGYNITALADYSAVGSTGTAGIVEGTAGTVCTVKVAEVVSLSVDGDIVKYAVVGTAISPVDMSSYIKTNATLVKKSDLTKAVDVFKQYAWGTPATGTDVELINAYAFDAGTGVTKVELWDAEKKAYDSADKASADYLPCDAKIKVTGTASTVTTDEGKIFRLTVNGEAYGKENIAPTAATKYTYELSNLGSLLDKDGKLTVAEESGYKVSINGTVLSGLFAGTEDMSSETELGLTASQVGTYLAVVDGDDLIAPTGAFEIKKGALDPDTNTFPYTMTGTLAATMVDKTTGTITLRPAVTVKFNEGGGDGKTEFGKITGTSILHSGYKLVATADVTYADTLYVVKGTTFTVTTVAGSALNDTALNLNKTDYSIAYKVLNAAGAATGNYIVTTGDKLTVTGADGDATLSATFTLDQGVEFDIVETADQGATWTGVNNATTT